jgi:hypothetical protein
MAGETSFLVEDFVEAIALQLDRVQDALAIKGEVRPLTYAVKDFSLQLHVFVEMDDQGDVRFRNSGPNEAGSSVVSMAFTTITKTMIQENTISLAQSRGPTLDEAGLTPREQRGLARIGVRNLHQLERLRALTGQRNIARLTGVPVDRIQQAVFGGQPQVTAVQPHPIAPPTNGHAQLVPMPMPRPTPTQMPMPSPMPMPVQPPEGEMAPPQAQLQPRLRIQGRNLLEDGQPAVRLNGQPLSIAEATDDGFTVHLPDASPGGRLEIELPNGQSLAYELSLQDDGQTIHLSPEGA